MGGCFTDPAWPDKIRDLRIQGRFTRIKALSLSVVKSIGI